MDVLRRLEGGELSAFAFAFADSSAVLASAWFAPRRSAGLPET